MSIDGRDLAIALEHPRGTERRTLLPYRDALNDVAVYRRLPVRDRDVIVRWVEIRRRLASEHGLDHDPANLADPLLAYAALRAHVLMGEGSAAAVSVDPNADLRDLVASIRSR